MPFEIVWHNCGLRRRPVPATRAEALARPTHVTGGSMSRTQRMANFSASGCVMSYSLRVFSGRAEGADSVCANEGRARTASAT